VRFNAQYAYTSEQFSDLGVNPALRIDSFGIWDAQVTFADLEDRFRVSLIGRNLTDESFASLITPGGPGGSLRYQIPREADRYYGVSFQTNF
jgi:iron complex outermembrane receptor protein